MAVFDKTESLKSHVSFPRSWGRRPSLIRRNRSDQVSNFQTLQLKILKEQIDLDSVQPTLRNRYFSICARKRTHERKRERETGRKRGKGDGGQEGGVGVTACNSTRKREHTRETGREAPFTQCGRSVPPAWLWRVSSRK